MNVAMDTSPCCCDRPLGRRNAALRMQARPAAGLTLCELPCSLRCTWPCTSSRCLRSSFPFVGRTHRVRGAASSADHETGLPKGPPEREAFFCCRGRNATNGPTEYLAIAFASRDAAGSARLRVSVAELVPDARVVRSRTGIVASLRELV